MTPSCVLQHITGPVAPSDRVLAYLASRGRLATMALTTIEPANAVPQVKEKQYAQTAPKLITPCDPWPRPYYFEEDLRKVRPYHYTYNTWCKERWRGREILEIFADEFRDRPLEYYVRSTPMFSSSVCLLSIRRHPSLQYMPL